MTDLEKMKELDKILDRAHEGIRAFQKEIDIVTQLIAEADRDSDVEKLALAKSRLDDLAVIYRGAQALLK